MSELLVGIYHADTEERRRRRSSFVEATIAAVGVLDFTPAIARVHAQNYAHLAKAGQMIGAHDLLIAATALYYDYSLLTANVHEFSRVPNLRLVAFSDANA